MLKLKKWYCRIAIAFAVFVLVFSLTGIGAGRVYATGTSSGDTSSNYGSTKGAPNSSNQVTGNGGVFNLTLNGESATLTSTVRILLILTILSLAPAILMMMTSFVRIIVVLHFVRAAIGTQTSPPNQILIGLALFLTIFIMWPTMMSINNKAIQPFDKGEITQEEALKRGQEPIREFMYGQTQTKDVRMFMEISHTEWTGSLDDIPNVVLIPSFIVSELRTAFIIGFLIYIPFIVIDMVVASTLMSMGMMMLPPTTISMPFKILLFVLADGWNLVIGNLVRTFY